MFCCPLITRTFAGNAQPIVIQRTLRLLFIGILVQLGWEAGLLIGGIRSAGFESVTEKLLPLVVNSLLETNLGMPYVFCIFVAYSRRFTEQLHRRKNKSSFTERIAELNP